MEDLESDYSLDEGQRDTSLRNYYGLMPHVGQLQQQNLQRLQKQPLQMRIKVGREEGKLPQLLLKQKRKWQVLILG